MNRASAGRAQQAFERLFNATCATAGLVFLVPVFAGLALVVLLDDGPPVFFSQIRVGKNGKPFRIWKFRTMRVGSRGSVITAAGDSRVTQAGAALRRWKLDELPQLFNVLKGDMSLVGPRPEAAEHVHLETPVWQAVLQVRPGITDLASLLYRNEEELLGAVDDPNTFYRESVLPAKLLLNLAYLRSRSFWLDLRLILLTVWYSLLPERFDPDRVKKTFDGGAQLNG
jgi:lipopolysaccharide/colanic/teichoic acid biosynthesis glycosyltransferase